tara:strand:+ start:253 stop:432 length:180 start_codon:yes stop_codon:yes gene_type:complete
MFMSYYERPSPEEYEDIIDDLERDIEEHKEHIKNLSVDVEFLEKENEELKLKLREQNAR